MSADDAPCTGSPSSGHAERITRGDAPTTPAPAGTAGRECSPTPRVMRRRLRVRSRARAGAADLLQFSCWHAHGCLAVGKVEAELWTGSWQSSVSGRRCIARHLLILPRCAGVCVGALVHWCSCHVGASRWQSTSLTRSRWARATSERQAVPTELGRRSRQRSSRTGPLLSHAKRAALVWRFAAKRWSIWSRGRPFQRHASTN